MKLEIHYLYTAKYAKWIIISLIAFFSLLIIIEWSSLFFLPNSTIVSTNVGNELVTRNKQAMIDNILKSSLFGEYVPSDLNSVKKSMLNVTLVGILLADKKDESQVIIGAANGDELSYKIGDKIPGGALIKKITEDGVLVERNGVLESLSLPKIDITFQPPAAPLSDQMNDDTEAMPLNNQTFDPASLPFSRFNKSEGKPFRQE